MTTSSMSRDPDALTRHIDPTRDIRLQKQRMDQSDPNAGIDDQELRERTDAAQAYAGEDETHFVDYALACIHESTEAQKDLRKVQSDCYNVYLENEPKKYAQKDSWQARIVVPKPFQTVQFGATAVKKAFSPTYLTIKNAKNEPGAEFWTKVMTHQLNETHANFPKRFTNSTIMALAIGVSMELIPRWIPGRGLSFSLVEPWKISRTPDAAVSEEPQSGIYWIHQEWLDYFVLKQGEKAGRYFDVARAKNTSDTDSNNPLMSQEAIAARKGMIIHKNKYRNLILTSEVWGQVLDRKGNLLLPSARYAIGANRVIQKPTVPQYHTLRWPGVSYSPLPDLLRFGGRGLLEGVLSIWEAMNDLMCLHHDY
ncbi:MAG: hypothetical protein JRC93_13390, partial [Deltaproteobacteria bacterium]|nr:hypothetical protein [Deltaproteobacteria bacterium]